jgi:hypothetical protein
VTSLFNVSSFPRESEGGDELLARKNETQFPQVLYRRTMRKLHKTVDLPGCLATIRPLKQAKTETYGCA